MCNPVSKDHIRTAAHTCSFKPLLCSKWHVHYLSVPKCERQALVMNQPAPLICHTSTALSSRLHLHLGFADAFTHINSGHLNSKYLLCPGGQFKAGGVVVHGHKQVRSLSTQSAR